jgi:hypothetical protein
VANLGQDSGQATKTDRILVLGDDLTPARSPPVLQSTSLRLALSRAQFDLRSLRERLTSEQVDAVRECGKNEALDPVHSVAGREPR